ncbi:MAG TPA: IS1595 family transposase [Pyrinomonadaceae bacterium]|jgi:transposase-like protein|nr:IS1595 family transposase [Pyrinomonadaceae bacterium]
MNLADLMERFSTVDAARDYLEKQRWPDGPECPHCGLVGEAYKITPKPIPPTTEYESKSELKAKRVRKPRRGLWKCAGCRKPFTVTVGTIFEDSHIPLNKWVIAVHLLCASKKGMSAHQLHRMLGVTYKSAWFMAHRIRYGMSQEPLASQLSGVVEADETYVGGRRRHPSHAIKADQRQQDRPAPTADKAAVFSVLQRDGRVRSTHMDRVKGENLKAALRELCTPDAHIITDEAKFYQNLKKEWKHSTVNHAAKEYARWEDGVCISTNSIEGFFSILKRGINGVYHHVSKQHLHRYLSEFDFRFNAREMSDSDRREAALKGFSGKRLMLHDPIAKKEN